MKVVYKSAIAEKIIEAVNHAAERNWPIEHIELTYSEWFSFHSYLVLLRWPTIPPTLDNGDIVFNGVKIIMEG